MIEKLRVHSTLLAIGIFIAGILLGSSSAILLTHESNLPVSPSVSLAPLREPSPPLLPTGSTSDPGSAPNVPPANLPTETPSTNMLTYTDAQFRFSIGYPATDFIKNEPLDTRASNLVHQAVFYNKELANSETANSQPPSCGVYIYTNIDHTPLPQWIAKNKPYVNQNGRPMPAAIGNAQGYKVTFSTDIYPGEYYYTEQGEYVYELVYCNNEVIQSFKVSQ